MNAAVFGTLFELAGEVIMTFVFGIGSIVFAGINNASRVFATTIHITDITTPEYVTLAFCQAFSCTDGSAIDFHISLTEYISAGVENNVFNNVIRKVVTESASATEDIAFYQTTVHAHLGFTAGDIFIQDISFVFQLHATFTNGGNFGTAIQTITDNTIPHVYLGVHYHSAYTITGTKEVTITFEQFVTRFAQVEVFHEIVFFSVVVITHITIVHIHFRGLGHFGHFTTTIDTAQNSRLAVVGIFASGDTDSHIRITLGFTLITTTKNVTYITTINGTKGFNLLFGEF